jgi:peptide/nickel transport system permease protein
MIVRYIIRRLIQMIPTIFGVVLITFILFNLIGGSPARMILGDKASARDLEAFDEQRGFNRPLFWGKFSPTRIYTETDFSISAGPWASVSGVVHKAGSLHITGPATVTFPMAFDYAPQRIYEWEIRSRHVSGDDKAVLVSSTNSLPLSETSWTSTSWRDQGGVLNQKVRPVITVPDGTVLEINAIQCRRVNVRPWESQWTHYLGQLIRLDFGRSHSANQSVVDLMRQGIGPTMMLATPILIGETLISLALALGCAYFRNRWFDHLVLVGCVMLMSVNYLVWIVAGQYWLGYKFSLFPVWGFESWAYLLLPVLVGIMHGLGPNVRFYRTVMLEEMHKDYVRTARAKGVGTPGILFRHVLKNAMIPVITNVVLSLPFLYTGSLLLETFFGIPGLGYLSVNAINSSDVDVVRAVVLIGSFLYLAANLLADLCYAWVDPRVKLS